MIRVRDQEEKGPLKAMRRCKKEQIPLAMIAGKIIYIFCGSTLMLTISHRK